MVLAVTDLSCGFRGQDVFAGVSLTVEPGQFVAVLGPNGVGKTTLLRSIARLHRPARGTIVAAGRDVWKSRPARVAEVVAFAPQVLAPAWPLSVMEFVALGRAPHRGWWRPLTAPDRRVVASAMEQLGLTKYASRRITELSGGEWQRVRLAKSLAQEPEILLLDEPTAHLDPRYQFELLTAVRDLTRSRKLAVVMTLHDLNLVGPWADRIALLARGAVLVAGEPAQVLTSELLSDAYGVPLSVAPHPLTAAPAVSLAPQALPSPSGNRT